jgi:chorismate mutase
MRELEALRETISAIDRRILELYEERMEAVRNVARYKQAAGIEIFDPAREQAVLGRIQDPGARRLIQMLMDLSKEEQRRVFYSRQGGEPG